VARERRSEERIGLVSERTVAMGSDLSAAGQDLFLTDEIGYLRACLEAAAATPEAFDLAVLLPRVRRAVDAVGRICELADEWDAEGVRLDPQAYENCARALREAITAALVGTQPGEDEKHG
jgi:hypothetical protein